MILVFEGSFPRSGWCLLGRLRRGRGWGGWSRGTLERRVRRTLPSLRKVKSFVEATRCLLVFALAHLVALGVLP